ncbi:MAG: Flp family type IVb pilin [Actinomycetota bacterium]
MRSSHQHRVDDLCARPSHLSDTSSTTIHEPRGRGSKEPEGGNMSGLVGFTRTFAGWITARLNVRSERGATAVEYGLMVALIAAVIIVAVVALGGNTKQAFQCTSDSVAARAAKC